MVCPKTLVSVNLIELLYRKFVNCYHINNSKFRFKKMLQPGSTIHKTNKESKLQTLLSYIVVNLFNIGMRYVPKLPMNVTPIKSTTCTL